MKAGNYDKSTDFWSVRLFFGWCDVKDFHFSKGSSPNFASNIKQI